MELINVPIDGIIIDFVEQRVYGNVNTYILEASFNVLSIEGFICLRLNQSYRLKML
jgi:hypothetical protein